MNQKSTATAYLLWFFLGVLGIHKFYLGKTGIGVLYLFTLGLLGFGTLYDLFTLPSQVRQANAEAGGVPSFPQQAMYAPKPAPAPSSPEQQILRLTTPDTYIGLRDIIRETGIELEIAEATIEKLLERGLLRRKMLDNGEVVYVER